MHMNGYSGSTLQIIKFMALLGDEGVPVQVDGEAWVQPPGVIRIIHKNRMQMLCRNRVSACFVRMLFHGLYKRLSTCNKLGHDMALAVSHGPLTVEAQVQPLAFQCWICGGQSGYWDWFSLSTVIFPCQYHFTVFHTHSFIHSPITNAICFQQLTISINNILK